MCTGAVKKSAWSLQYVPDRFKRQEMCTDAVKKGAWLLEYVPDCFKMQEMCTDAVEKGAWMFEYVSDWLKDFYKTKRITYTLDHDKIVVSKSIPCNEGKDYYYIFLTFTSRKVVVMR